MLAAIVAKAQGTTSLAGFIGATSDGHKGPFLGGAPNGTAFPFTSLHVIPGRVANVMGAGAYMESFSLQFNVYGQGGDDVLGSMETLCAVYDWLQLTPATGAAAKLLRTGSPSYSKEAYLGPNGREVYKATASYSAKVDRVVGAV